MGESEKDKPQKQENEVTSKKEEQKKSSAKDKLREKLEKLKKDDPNIYPVF